MSVAWAVVPSVTETNTHNGAAAVSIAVLMGVQRSRLPALSPPSHALAQGQVNTLPGSQHPPPGGLHNVIATPVTQLAPPSCNTLHFLRSCDLSGSPRGRIHRCSVRCNLASQMRVMIYANHTPEVRLTSAKSTPNSLPFQGRRVLPSLSMKRS